MPTGHYRFRVYGHTSPEETGSWPYAKSPYEITSEPFSVEPATISIAIDDTGVWAHIQAPDAGYRLIDVEGQSRGPNPVDTAALFWVMSDGTLVEDPSLPSTIDGRSYFETRAPEGATALEITDLDGNWGGISFE